MDYFKSKIMNKGAYADLVGREEQLTTITSAAVFIKYNPGSRISYVLGFKKNSNMTLMQAIDFLNQSSQKLNGKPEYYTRQLLNKK